MGFDFLVLFNLCLSNCLLLIAWIHNYSEWRAKSSVESGQRYNNKCHYHPAGCIVIKEVEDHLLHGVLGACICCGIVR
jgi:hypothetical protein